MSTLNVCLDPPGKFTEMKEMKEAFNLSDPLEVLLDGQRPIT